MRKLVTLLICVLSAYQMNAQEVSIMDFCYIDHSEDGTLLETFSDDTMVATLIDKGFLLSSSTSFAGEGAGGYTTIFTERILEYPETGTTVTICQGPCEIKFKSTDTALKFVNYALRTGLFYQDEEGTCYPKFSVIFGGESFWQHNDSVRFSISVP